MVMDVNLRHFATQYFQSTGRDIMPFVEAYEKDLVANHEPLESVTSLESAKIESSGLQQRRLSVKLMDNARKSGVTLPKITFTEHDLPCAKK